MSLARRSARDSLRREPRQQPVAVLDINETNIIENNFVQEFRNAQRNLAINVANGQTGFANNGLPGQVALPSSIQRLERGDRSLRSPPLPAQNAAFITNLQQGEAGRLANTLAGNAANSGATYTCRCWQRPAGLRITRVRRAGQLSINFFQANPFAAGFRNKAAVNARLLTEKGVVGVRRPAAAVPPTLPQWSVDHGGQYIRQGSFPPLFISADFYAELPHPARQVAGMGTDRLRPAAHLPGVRHVRLPFGDGAATTSRMSRRTGAGRLGRVGNRPDAVRQAVPAGERTADAQPGKCGRHP